MEVAYRKNSELTKKIVDKIDGLQYHPNFLTKEKHDELFSFLQKLDYNLSNGRPTKFFGLDYKFNRKHHNKEKEPLPDYLNLLKPMGLNYDQLVIQHFRKEDGHNYMKEGDVFQDNVIIIVLGSSFVYNLKKNDGLILDFLVEPRSLLLISEGSSKWERKINRRVKERFNKCIIPRKDFYLLTYRNVK